MNFRKIPTIIIGAGVSGLTIASKLCSDDYLILEARDRIGGRVLTNDKNIDDGAAWMHGLVGNPLAKLLSEDNLIPVATCNPWMHSDKANIQYFCKTPSNFTEEKRAQVWDHIQAKLMDNSTLTIADAFTECGEEFQSFLYMIEVWCGGSVDVLPASFLQNEGNSNEPALFGDYAGSHCMFKNGAKTLLDKLCESVCKDKILYNQVVTKIVYKYNIIEITTQCGNTFYCDKLCITVPTGPLKDIVFDPPLNQDKVDAIAKIKFGSYKKIQIEFDEVFWDKNVDMILTQNDEKAFILWNNYMRTKNKPILEAILPAENGWKLLGKSDEEIMDAVMQHLNKYFENVPFPKS